MGLKLCSPGLLSRHTTLSVLFTWSPIQKTSCLSTESQDQVSPETECAKPLAYRWDFVRAQTPPHTHSENGYSVGSLLRTNSGLSQSIAEASFH